MSGDGNRGKCRRMPPPMVLAVAGVLLAGCGSGSPAAPNTHSGESSHHVGGTAFEVQVDEVCARAVAAHAGHAFPVANFHPEDPDAAQLPVVGAYLARYGGAATTDAALHALKPPSAGADSWRHLLDLVDEMAANAQRQIVAARAGDVSGFVHTVKTTSRLATEIDTAGIRFGFTGDSPCGQIFG